MAKDKRVHFGWFIRAERGRMSVSLKKMGAAVGITDRRLSQIEQMETPEIYADSYAKIAQFFGLTPEALTQKWKTTEVEEPEFRPPPGQKLAGDVSIVIPFDLAVQLRAAAPDVTLADLLIRIAGEWLDRLRSSGPPSDESLPAGLATAEPVPDGQTVFEERTRPAAAKPLMVPQLKDEKPMSSQKQKRRPRRRQGSS